MVWGVLGFRAQGAGVGFWKLGPFEDAAMLSLEPWAHESPTFSK